VTDRIARTVETAVPERSRASALAQTLLRSEWPWMLYLAFVVLCVVFSFASPWFLSVDNFLNIGRQTTLVSIVAAFLLFGLLDAVRTSFTEAGQSANAAKLMPANSTCPGVGCGRNDTTMTAAPPRASARSCSGC